MKIAHISDNHSIFPKLLKSNVEAIVMTGDFFPNFVYGRNQEPAYQKLWLEEQIPTLKKWIDNRPFIFVLGNHDFINPDLMERILRDNGIDAYNTEDKIVSLHNINFYGFPYIPYINGSWNYERAAPEMIKEVSKLTNILNSTYVDVLLAHAPPYKCLDANFYGQSIGNTAMATALDYKISKDMQPSYYLTGHVHESFGTTIRDGMLVSNAATFQNIIQL